MTIQILLADDDSIDRELFAEALKLTNLDAVLHEVSNGKALFDFLEKESRMPDLIFLDLNMPLMDGREILRELKADKNLSMIPVIIFSTSNSQFDVEESYQSGASLFVSKPHDFKELVEMLGHFLTLGSKYISFPSR